MRIYDPRLGRFLSADPLYQDYPFYTPYQFAGNTPIRAFDLDGLEITFSDVWNNKASIVDWINDPGTWTQGAKNINESINPIYQAYGHGYEITTGKDFNTGEYKGRTRAVADAGVNGMMWLTGEKVFCVFRYENAVEKQMLKNLGCWLGALTLSRDRPILHKHLSLKVSPLRAHAHRWLCRDCCWNATNRR